MNIIRPTHRPTREATVYLCVLAVASFALAASVAFVACVVLDEAKL